jgi:predicted flavoprotein YhiN
MTAADAAGGVTKAQRAQLVELLKAAEFTVTGTRGFQHAQITLGGVDWQDVDPTTLESRRVAGLFFAGELLDVAGRCGGFNLQAAFSTGFLAGSCAARGRAG